jgi:hypothetical protein
VCEWRIQKENCAPTQTAIIWQQARAGEKEENPGGILGFAALVKRIALKKWKK